MIWSSRNSERSTFCEASVRTMFLPAVPNVNWAGEANSSVLNHRSGVGLLSFGSPTRSGLALDH